MCKKRDPGYREDILAICTVKPDGNYELDTGSEAYYQLKNKYVIAKLPPRFNAETRDRAESGAIQSSARQQVKDRLKAVQYEDVYRKGRGLIDILGQASAFAFAYAEFIDLERRGYCKSCSRRGQLQKLALGLKTSILGASLERRQQVRDLFPDTVFFEVVPTPVKWEDLMK